MGRNSAVTAISEEGEGECGLSTQFIDWSARYDILSLIPVTWNYQGITILPNIRYFSTRLMRLPGSEDSDGESGEHWQREWWRARNERVMTRSDAASKMLK